ncbi:MAG: hypothetical protein AABX98_02455 [Nanoarchaeota archaeon]
MTTTIQVNEETVNVLKLLRDQFKVPSYDALLKILITKAVKPKKSMWGAGGKLSMKEVLKDLRDKSDRY